MSRKVLISFLGITNYHEVPYQLNDNEPIKTRFTQVALYQYLCQNFTVADKVLIFTTPSAKATNWFDNGHKKFGTNEIIQCKGLESCFKDIGLQVEAVDILEGKKESEIWDIFQKVFNQLEENDEIYFDITHSLRSIPMLNMVLINYAKLLKNVSISGIYYGAFENDGLIKPIWNLTSYSELQDWTLAVSSFITAGDSKGIKMLAQKEVLPILQNKNDSNTTLAQELFQLAKSIEFVTDALTTNRGYEIVNANIFKNLNTNISTISNANFIPPFKPIIELIEKKTKRFSGNHDVLNGFLAVEWCIEHNLIPQGYTMLQENIFTYYCTLVGLDYKCEGNRALVSSALHNINHNKDADNKIVSEIMAVIPKNMASLYESMTQDRNDINHGGFSRFETSKNLVNKLKSNFMKCKELLNF